MKRDSLSDKVVLITGGCGDIGKACAIRLASMGATMVVNDIREEAEGTAIAEEIAGHGGQCIYVKCDVSQPSEVKQMFKTILEAFGRIDICNPNAGIVQDVPFLDLTPQIWRRHIDINLSGAFYVALAAARIMVEQKTQGKIIFTGSFVQEVPEARIAPYCASKGGMKMLAKTMALELAQYGITVNLIAPGIVDAGLSAQEMRDDPALRPTYKSLVPLGELQTLEQVADAFAFLASPGSDYMTGATLLMDGGCSLFKFGL